MLRRLDCARLDDATLGAAIEMPITNGMDAIRLGAIVIMLERSDWRGHRGEWNRGMRNLAGLVRRVERRGSRPRRR
jgi:hypothetical protein